jgi:photosystem II stability/assembly factor-like uncharacterized protein
MHFIPVLKKGIVSIALVFLLVGPLSPVPTQAARMSGAISISPSAAVNNAATPVVIQGSDFTPSTTAHLGSSILSVSYVSESQLNATVPWGLSPGVYDLSISDPDRPNPTVLSNAFTVTLGLGKWVNNGPFGGQVLDLVLQPGNPSRLYACVLNAGLFVSTDGAASWTMLINASFPMRLLISPADPLALYLNTNRSILRSLDGGISWTEIRPDANTPGGTLAAFPHPSEPGTVYIAASPNMNNYTEGGNGELWKSTDHGDTFSPLANAGLTDKRITELVFDPQDASHQTLLAGTILGNIFQSSDGGANWTLTADLHRDTDQKPARIDRLVFNPSGAKEPWAVKRNPFMDTDWPVFYRSLPDRSTWSGQMVVDNPTGGPHPWFWMRPWSLTFSTTTLWAAYDTGYTSPNAASLSWSRLNPNGLPNESWRDFEFTSFVIDPTNRNTIYAGTREHGVYKSTDGGQTWSPANLGLAGVNPYALAVSPDNLDEVYAVSQTDGVAKSSDGGQHWTLLNFQRGGFPWQQTSLVVDPHDPRVVYLGMWCPHSRPQPATASDACVRISRDRGQTWTDVILPQPPPANFQSGEVFAIAVDPQHAGRVVAGATFYPVNWSQNVEHPYGAFYYSENYGETWTWSGVDATLLKGSYRIGFDSGDASLVYAATDGSGLWKSSDGGMTWNRVSWTGCADTGEANTLVSVHALAAHPTNSGELYAVCQVTVNQQPRSHGLYRSTNAGQSWTAVQDPPGGVESLLFLPSPRGLTLYAGGWSGAARSLDGGQSWMSIDGLPMGAVYAMAGGADTDRSVMYLSTEAGMGTASTQSIASAGFGLQAVQRVMAGGTYGLAQRLMKPMAYLPMVRRAP